MKSPSEWIGILAKHQNRQYYRDQTPESLEALIWLAKEYAPTVIVELGTCFGLSLRAWIAANTGARITAIDRTFRHLKDGLKALPMDLAGINLIERDIEDVDFLSLWNETDRVLLYCDVHGAELVRSIVDNAIDLLPANSLVVVDDLWYSEDKLNPTTAQRFFAEVVSHQTDPMIAQEHQPCYFAHHWAGGSLFGFAEAPVVCEYLNQWRIDTGFQSKVAWWLT